MRIERQVIFWLAAVIVFVIAVMTLKAVLLPFVAGLVIAYALNPLTEGLVRLGLSRIIASASVVALGIVVLALVAIFVVPPLMVQIQNFIEAVPGEAERLKNLVEAIAKDRLGPRFADFKTALDRGMADLSGNLAGVAGVVAQAVWAQGLALVNLVSLLLITPVVVFYLLVDWRPMLTSLDRSLPRDHAPTIRRLAGEIDAAIAAFIRGQGLVCLILGTIYAIGLSWAGVRYGLLLGIATGILCFVPFAGWALGLIVTATIALVQAWPDLTLLYKVLGVFAFAVALDAALLSPAIVGARIGLHPVWLIFSLFVFSYLFGFVGVLIAVPLGAAIAVLVRYSIQVYLDSEVYRGRGEGGSPVVHHATPGDPSPGQETGG